MIITRVLPHDVDDSTVQDVISHVTAELSASAAADDDPDTNADNVQVNVYEIAAGTKNDTTGETYETDCVLVVGVLDMEPDAPYLKPDFDPYEGVPLHLRMHAQDDVVTVPEQGKGGRHERRQ